MLHADIMVVGGGVAGFSLTALLAQAGLSVICVDRAPLADRIDKNRDGRAQALSAATCRVLDAIGAWSLMAPHAAAITDIAILDADAPVALNFLSREIGDQAFGQNIDITIIRSCLAQILGNLPTATVMAPAAVVGFRAEAASIVADLEDGRQVRAKLLVAADGRESPLRQMAGIGVTRWTYDQQAIVCAMHHENPHDGRALEHFFPEGPFAVLPLSDGPDGVFRSSVVWTTKPAIAAAMMDVNDVEFTAGLQEKCGERLGRVALVPGRWCYPLGVHHAHHYIAPRLVLVGDAGHAMHPIAGQGLNMGMRDVASLAEIIIERARLGLDIGTMDGLRRYQQWRRPDNIAYISFTDGLNRLFSNHLPPVALARRVGLSMVERLPPIKHFFMRQAMGTGRGIGGRLPRVMQAKK
jgi:2-octaprenyl-6-methoxyphenol hydroxylase